MQAFIFDFDGVIIDSERYWDEDAIAVYRSMIPSFTREDDKKLKGRSVRDIYPWLVETYGFTRSWEEYMAVIDRYARNLYATRANVISGIRELIVLLRQCGIPVAIASSSQKEWIDAALMQFRLQDAFHHIVTADEVGIGKPNPAVYLEAAARLGADPKACVALEDSTNGIASAKAAQMTCIALRHAWGYAQDLSRADKIIDSVEELTEEVLKKL